MVPDDIGNTPRYWIRPTAVLQATPGFHRFMWDLHYAPPAGTSALPGDYPISAVPYDTPREPRGPWALPGEFTARLTLGGKSYSQTFTVKMDPRIKTPAAAIAQEHALAVKLFDDIARDSAIVAEARALHARLTDARGRTNDASLAAAIDAFDERIAALAGGGGGGGRRGGRGRGGAAQTTFTSVNGDLLAMLALLEEADEAPTPQTVAAANAARRDFDALVVRWTALRGPELDALDAKLRAAGQRAP